MCCRSMCSILYDLPHEQIGPEVVSATKERTPRSIVEAVSCRATCSLACSRNNPACPGVHCLLGRLPNNSGCLLACFWIRLASFNVTLPAGLHSRQASPHGLATKIWKSGDGGDLTLTARVEAPPTSGAAPSVPSAQCRLLGGLVGESVISDPKGWDASSSKVVAAVGRSRRSSLPSSSVLVVSCVESLQFLALLSVAEKFCTLLHGGFFW